MWTMCINLISNYILPGWDKYYTNYDWSWFIILLLFTFFIGAEFKLTLHVYIKICPGWLMLSPGLDRTGDGPISSCCGITDDGQTFRQINNCAFSTDQWILDGILIPDFDLCWTRYGKINIQIKSTDGWWRGGQQHRRDEEEAGDDTQIETGSCGTVGIFPWFPA